MLDLLDTFRPNITAKGKQVIGHTKVHLEGGSICRLRECNLGNLIADSMVYSRMLENKGGEYWTDAAIALIAGGGTYYVVDKSMMVLLLQNPTYFRHTHFHQKDC